MSQRRNDDLERDLESLRTVTERGLPTIQHTARTLAARSAGRAQRPIEEGFWMRSRRFWSARPGLAIAGAAVLVAIVLGIVPVSYDRTVGHDVTLSLGAPAPEDAALGRIATELERALGTRDVRVRTPLGGGSPIFAARVAGGWGREVERTAAAFASALTARGIPASAQVEPRRQHVSTNLIARAMDRVIELRIERAGRSPAEIEADIRTQLEAAGVRNPQVQVSQDGDQTRIDIQGETQEPGAEGEVHLKLQATGDEPLNPQLHQFQVERKPGMTDADVKAEVERQMREAGMQGEVSVENGKIEIRAHKEEMK
jgi:hypothetical protein